MANRDMYEQLLVEEVLNFQKSVSCESRFEYKFINFFSGLLCNFWTNHIFTILQLKVKMIWFFGWIFIYEDILWYLLYKEWMSLTISPEHYLPGHVLKCFQHVHGIIVSIVHVKVISRRIQNCCDYSCLLTL